MRSDPASRIAALEARLLPIKAPRLLMTMSNEPDLEITGAEVEGVGFFERHSDESRDQFVERIYRDTADRSLVIARCVGHFNGVEP